MQTTHIKTTLRKAKADFKKQGPRIPEHQIKKHERAAELEQRAAEAREREKKRKQAKRKRDEKDQKEREAKRRNGIGLATQLAGYSHTQKQMKSGMEAFIGKGKAKEHDKENNTSCAAEKVEDSENLASDHIVESKPVGELHGGEGWEEDECLFDEEKYLQDLQPLQRLAPTVPLTPPAHSLEQETVGNSDSRDIEKPGRLIEPLSAHMTLPDHISGAIGLGLVNSDEASNPSPPQRQVQNATELDSVSPDRLWDEFLVSNTQITRELSQPAPEATVKSDPIPLMPLSTQDLELSSVDLIELNPSSKPTNPKLDPAEGILTRDFAFFKQNPTGEVVLRSTPGIPKWSSRTFGKRSISFDRRAASAASPKITGGGFTPNAAQRSFTSAFDCFGLSTQIMQDAVDDTESDTEEEDFLAAIPESTKIDRDRMPPPPSQDRILMPPPPSRTCPKVFKPPSPKTGGFQAFGLSTQILHDVVSENVRFSSDEMDVASSSFGAEDLEFWDEAVLDGKAARSG
jgi:hypothetical protein